MASGALLGGIRSQSSLASFGVSGQTPVVIDPPHSRLLVGERASRDLRLVGYDLDSGEEHWRLALRDRRYLGPLPNLNRLLP